MRRSVTKTLLALSLIAVLWGLVVAPTRCVAQEKPEVQAQKSDEAWLALVDAGKYADSWKTASSIFQEGVSEEMWGSAVGRARSSLGKVKSRKLKSAVYSTTLPGAPDGEYVVAKFETEFEHKQSAIETVVSNREKDGSWRVAGYFIS
jgi:hypothetical protein